MKNIRFLINRLLIILLMYSFIACMAAKEEKEHTDLSLDLMIQDTKSRDQINNSNHSDPSNRNKLSTFNRPIDDDYKSIVYYDNEIRTIYRVNLSRKHNDQSK